MGALETAMAAVRGSEKLGAGEKEMVTAFLQAAGPAIVGLGEKGLAAVLGAAAEGADVQRVVTENLDARGVAALLTLTETQMAALAERHATEAQAARAAVETLKSAALMALARVVLGVL